MTNLEMLYRPGQLENELNRKKMWRESLFRSYCSDKTDMARYGSTSASWRKRLEDMANEIREIDKTIIALNEEINESRRQAIEMLNRLFPYPKSALLERRYLEGRKWKDIAAELSYAEKYCLQLNRDCLKVLENSGK